MEGPNPFAAWEESVEQIYGRKEEARLFRIFLNSTASKQPGILVVSGGPGCGKSFILDYFRSEAEKNGMLVAHTRVQKGESAEDVMDKIYQEGRSAAGAGKGGPPPETFAALCKELEGLAKKGRFGTMVMIDDVDLMRRPDDALADIGRTVAASRRKALSFVLSSTRVPKTRFEFMTNLPLRPFEEHDMKEMVDKALKKGALKMGDECFNIILQDSSGNPRLIRMICKNIYDRIRENEKVITKGHYLAYLPYIMSILSREWFGRIYQETPLAERAILRTIAKNDAGMHVSDISGEIGKPLGQVTALVGRLVDSGQLVRIGRGKYVIFSRLYGKYVLQRG